MTPKAAPKASAIAVVLALLLCVLGVVVGRDALIAFGAITGTPWIGDAIDWIVGLTAQTWMLPAGIAIAVLGIVLFLAALLPRSRTHKPADSEGVWLSRNTKRTRVSIVGKAAATADRLGSFVVGAALIAVGVGAAAWQRDVLPTPISDARRTFDSWSPADWDDQQWWQWALTGVALLLIVVGLRWLFAHRPRRQAAQLTTVDDEHARVNLASATSHAAAEFASAPGIDSATARIVQLGKTRVLRVSGVTDGSETPTADVVAAAAELREMCGTALAGLAVDTQVLIDVRPVR